MNYSDISLSSREKKILKYLSYPIIELPRYTVTKSVLMDRLKIGSDDAEYSISRLRDLNLIQYRDTFEKEANYYLIRTPAGTEFLNYLKQSLYKKISWSIIVPILTSAVTSYLTTSYFGR